MATPLEIVGVPAFADNYLWLIHDPDSGETAVVDPGDPAVILSEAERRCWRIDKIINTHWHPDHTGGQDPFLWYFSAAVSLREENIPAAKSSINRALAMAPDSAEVLFEAGHVAKAAGEDAQAREYWTKAIAANPNGPTGKAAREAMAMTDAPLTVTNQVSTRPDGDGEGGKPE